MNSNSYKSVLIVDDEEDICMRLKRIFEIHKPDYRVVTAPNAFIAIEQLMKHGFDLVLTNWLMSDMDGLELAGVIRDMSPDTQILLMTGTPTPELDGAIKSLGLNGWVEKPFTPTYILKVVEQTMG